jgi:hypothetical protein
MTKTKNIEYWQKLWERSNPGMGGRFIDLIGAFYQWSPSLSPAPSDIVDRVRRAIFWRNVEGVHLVGLEFMPSYFAPYLFGGYGEPEHDVMMPPRRVRRLFEYRLLEVQDNLLSMTLGTSDHRLYYYLKWAFRDTLYVPCWLLAQGREDEAVRYDPLFLLWRSGNFPIGFDPSDGKPLILTRKFLAP